MIDSILLQAPLFLLIFARCFAMLMTLPLFSMRSVSRAAKVALAGYIAFFVMGTNDFSSYSAFIAEDQAMSLEFLLLVGGEAVIGIILGFYVTIIFSAFSSAGQFAAFQMGFSAASTYDALAQVENPLLGQFFNFMAMLIFMQTKWFQKLFLGGLAKSFVSMNIFTVIAGKESIMKFMISGLTKLFADALVISLPIMGTLLLITICTGLLSKAAPQMNLLSEGFPIMILVSFFIILIITPSLCDFFIRSFNSAFTNIESLFKAFGGGN